VSLSWLAGTTHHDDDRALGLRLSESLRPWCTGTSQESRGSRHYSKGHRADDWSWSVMWGGLGGASGTVYVEVRQSVWECGAPLTLALGLLSILRPSRVDLAADVLGPGFAVPSALFRALPAAETRTHRASWVLTVDGCGGEKLTVGARSSERYLRVYVKGANWVRHELELKGANAGAAADALRAGAAPAAIFSAEYGRVVRWH